MSVSLLTLVSASSVLAQADFDHAVEAAKPGLTTEFWARAARGDDAPAFVPALSALLVHIDPDTRARAAMALSAYASEAELIAPRLKATASREGNLLPRSAAIHALAALAHKAERPELALPWLIELIERDEGDTSEIAIIATARMAEHADAAVPALVEAFLRPAGERVWSRGWAYAAQTLANLRLRPDYVLPRLARLIESVGPSDYRNLDKVDVAMGVIAAYGSGASGYADLLAGRLDYVESHTAVTSCMCLRQLIAETQVVPQSVVARARGGDAQVRQLAIEALSVIHQPSKELVEIARDGLQHRSDGVRLAAAAFLVETGTDVDSGWSVLSAHLEESRSSPYAATLCGRLPVLAERSVPRLTRFLRANDHMTPRCAGRLGHWAAMRVPLCPRSARTSSTPPIDTSPKLPIMRSVSRRRPSRELKRRSLPRPTDRALKESHVPR